MKEFLKVKQANLEAVGETTKVIDIISGVKLASIELRSPTYQRMSKIEFEYWLQEHPNANMARMDNGKFLYFVEI